MDTKDLEADRALIDALGGTSKLAAKLGISAQVVTNWKTRGIPARVKLDWPDLFLPDMKWNGSERRRQPAAKVE